MATDGHYLPRWQAYAVLSDPARRRKYDDEGFSAVANQPRGDPGAVFAMMFGERQFEDYVGELTTVMQMRLADSPAFASKEAQVAELKRLQKERELNLAKKLALRLDGWLADKEGFVREMLRVLANLLKLNLGGLMCAAIGLMYELTAESILGVQGRFAQVMTLVTPDCPLMTIEFRDRFAQLGFGGANETVHQMATASRMVSAMSALSEDKAKAAEHPSQRVGAEKLETNMFHIMALDIESTVAAAAKLCLFDTSISKAVRRERASGLLKVGLIFQGKLPGLQPPDIAT